MTRLTSWSKATACATVRLPTIQAGTILLTASKATQIQASPNSPCSFSTGSRFFSFLPTNDHISSSWHSEMTRLESIARLTFAACSAALVRTRSTVFLSTFWIRAVDPTPTPSASDSAMVSKASSERWVWCRAVSRREEACERRDGDTKIRSGSMSTPAAP